MPISMNLGVWPLFPVIVIWSWRRCSPKIPDRLNFTSSEPALRDHLEEAIRTGIADIAQQVVLLRQEDSQKHRGLQAVDHIAWASYQKYEREDNRFWKLIQSKVVVEEVVEHHLW
jgi:hypothetical protein